MKNFKSIFEGISSQGKMMGSRGSSFRDSSSSSDQNSGLSIGASRAKDHEDATKDASIASEKNRKNEIEKRNKEAEQRQKETMQMSQEETVTEAKHVFHVHLHPIDTRLGKMVDDKTVEPIGNKPKGDKIKLTIPAADTRSARDKATRYAAKNFGVDNVKTIEYKGLHEETVTEAKMTKKFVFDKPYQPLVKAYSNHDTDHLKDMHKRWSESHQRNMKGSMDTNTSEKLLAVNHVLKSRGEDMKMPEHKNLGMHTYNMQEETNTEKREKIKNVARMDDVESTSEKSTLSKTDSIKTKIVEEKPTMSLPNFGLSASLIAAARQIVEKKDDVKLTGGKTQVEVGPETDDRSESDEDTSTSKKKEKKTTDPKTEKEKKLAALASPKDKITHKDVLVGRGVLNKEEVDLDERENSPYERASDTALDKQYGYGTSYDKTPKTSFGRAANRSSAAYALRALRKNPDTDTETGSDAVHQGWAKTATTSTDQTPEKKARRATLASTPYSKLPDDEKEKDRVAFNAVKKTFNKEEIDQLDEEGRVKLGHVSAGPDVKKDVTALKSKHKDTHTDFIVRTRGPKEPSAGLYKNIKVSPQGGMKSKSATGFAVYGRPKMAKEDFTADELARIDEIAKSIFEIAAPGLDSDKKYAKGDVTNAVLSDEKKPGMDDDQHKHPMQQLEKIAHSVEGREPSFEHKDGSKTKVGKTLARQLKSVHDSMKTTQEKNKFADSVHASRDSMRAAADKHL